MRTVLQTQPPAPAVANHQSSVARAAAPAVANACRWCQSAVISHQLKSQDPCFPAHRRGSPVQTRPTVRSPHPQNGPATQPRSRRASRRHRNGRGQTAGGARSRGAAGVATAAKPNWSWSSKSWGPAAAVTCSACCTASPSSTTACLTTWAAAVRRPSSRWSSWTARWAGHASASERSAPERPPPRRRKRERERVCVRKRDGQEVFGVHTSPLIPNHTRFRTIMTPVQPLLSQARSCSGPSYLETQSSLHAILGPVPFES